MRGLISTSVDTISFFRAGLLERVGLPSDLGNLPPLPPVEPSGLIIFPYSSLGYGLRPRLFGVSPVEIAPVPEPFSLTFISAASRSFRSRPDSARSSSPSSGNAPSFRSSKRPVGHSLS